MGINISGKVQNPLQYLNNNNKNSNDTNKKEIVPDYDQKYYGEKVGNDEEQTYTKKIGYFFVFILICILPIVNFIILGISYNDIKCYKCQKSIANDESISKFDLNKKLYETDCGVFIGLFITFSCLMFLFGIFLFQTIFSSNLFYEILIPFGIIAFIFVMACFGYYNENFEKVNPSSFRDIMSANFWIVLFSGCISFLFLIGFPCGHKK
jgi:uncharacterized membrane protein